MIEIKNENVWDYPRPAVWESYLGEIKVIENNIVLAKSNNAIRILETSHPPTYYFPLNEVKVKYLKTNNHTSFCEWKGLASYFDLCINGKVVENVGWTYLKPSKNFIPIKNFISFYASKVDQCFVNNEQVKRQEGEFYGGWITNNLLGPFKGGPKTIDW